MLDYDPTLEDYDTLLTGYMPTLPEDGMDYLEYIRDAYYVNIKKDKFQFAILAFHIMYMSFIYKTLWLIKNTEPDKSKNFFDGNQIETKQLNNFFDFSPATEKNSIKTLKFLGFHQNLINSYCNFVDIRNDCAHCAGFIQYKNEEDLKTKFKDIIKSVETIFSKYTPLLKRLFEEYLNSISKDTSAISFSVEDFIYHNGISQKDFEFLANQDWPFLKLPITDIPAMRKKVFLLTMLCQHGDTDMFISKFSSVFQNIPETDLRDIITSYFGFLSPDSYEIRGIEAKMEISLFPPAEQN